MGGKSKAGVPQKRPRFHHLPGKGHAGTSGAATAASVGTTREDWPARNGRRISLITKQFSDGLTPDEEAELADLQAEADRYLDEVAPLPFEHLEKLEERVRLLAAPPAGGDRDTPRSS